MIDFAIFSGRVAHVGMRFSEADFVESTDFKCESLIRF